MKVTNKDIFKKLGYFDLYLTNGFRDNCQQKKAYLNFVGPEIKALV